MDTSNIFKYNGYDPFDNWTLKDNKLMGYYPRNSLINLLSSVDSGIEVYPTYCVIRNNVKTIARNTFRNNYRFDFIVLSEGIEVIEEYAFYHVNAKEIGIPRSIKRIENNAFSKDIKLYVYKDSYGERYAMKNGYKYEYYQEDK